MVSLVPQVVRITTISRPTLTNFEARGVTQSGKMGDEPYRAYGLTGKNQICGIADSGINDLSCFFIGETRDRDMNSCVTRTRIPSLINDNTP